MFLLLLFECSCGSSGIGGDSWDDLSNVENAKQYPSTASNRITVRSEEVPFQSFKQEFNSVFDDFPFNGAPVGSSSGNLKTRIGATPYSVSYENVVLKIYKDDAPITQRILPNIFTMHPMNSGVILGAKRSGDRILCRTVSRSTTGLHYVLILDGNGEIIFEKVLGAADEWDILPGIAGNIILGGARTKIVISNN
jgi:hypothetical protein